MTQFLTSYVPQEITTIEQLVVWASEILVFLYPDNSLVQTLDQNGDDVLSRQVEGNKFYYTVPTDPEWRYVAQASIKLSANHLVYGRIWEHAQPIGSETVPTQMRRVA